MRSLGQILNVLDGLGYLPFAADATLSIVQLRPASWDTMHSAAIAMGVVGVKHGPEAASAAQPRRTSRKLWIGVAAALAIAASVLIWQRTAILDLLVPGFQVANMNSIEKTMTLERASHTYVVQCGNECGRFLPGHSYRMEIVGGELHYHSAGREVSLPILEEQEVFTRPGGHG